jgi:hypothetical protein
MVLLMYDVKNDWGDNDTSWRIVEFPIVLMVMSHFLGVSTERWKESLDFLFESVVDYADTLEFLLNIGTVKSNEAFVKLILKNP